MTINFGLNYDPNTWTCTDGSDLEQDYFTTNCIPCAFADDAQYLSSNVRRYLATTDYTFIHNYWADNVITIGFCTGYSATPAGFSGTPGINLHDFNATLSPPPNTWTHSTPLLASLILKTNGDYEASKDFDSFASVLAGNTVEVNIVANFKNGESINEHRTITLVDNDGAPTTPSFKNVLIQIRGNIEEYNASVTNYRIDIYQ